MTSQNAEPSEDTAVSPTPAEGPQRNRVAPEGADALEAGLESTVVAYLQTHPDFFQRNPDVLAELHVSHVTGGAVSLIEHQVGVLRRQLETERNRLGHLISRARDYESLSNRLHGLVLQIIPAVDLAQLRRVLEDALSREFSAEAVTLKLFPIDPAPDDGKTDPLTREFLEFLDREHALCGPLTEDKNQVLFGGLGAGVRSAALVPVRSPGRSGVLAIGATDPDRFKPDMGTDLLDRLGEIVSGKLGTLPALAQPGQPEDQREQGPSPKQTQASPDQSA